MLILFTSIIMMVIAISLGLLIKKGRINPYIKAYKEPLDDKSECTFLNKVSDYLGNSFYALGLIMISFGLIDYAGYTKSIIILVIALVIWFITTFVGAQLITTEE